MLSADHWHFMADAYQNGHVFFGWRQYLALFAVPILVVALYMMYAVLPMHIMLDRLIRREQYPGPGTWGQRTPVPQTQPGKPKSTTLESRQSPTDPHSQRPAPATPPSIAPPALNNSDRTAHAKTAPATWSIPVSRVNGVDLGSVPLDAATTRQAPSPVLSVADLNILLETMSVEERKCVLAYERDRASAADLAVETIAGSVVSRHQQTVLRMPGSAPDIGGTTAPPPLPVAAHPAIEDAFQASSDDRIGAAAAGLTLVVDHAINLSDGGAQCRLFMAHASVPMELGEPKWMICLILLVEDQRTSTMGDLGQIIDVLATDALKTIFDRLASVDVITLAFVVLAGEQDTAGIFLEDLPPSVHALPDNSLALAEFLDLIYAPRKPMAGPAFLSVLNSIKADIDNL